MNPQYLFRGKRRDNGEWIEGSLCERQDSFGSIKTIQFQKEDDESFEVFEYQVIPETVGLWTTQLDRKGRRIFQGDILDGHSDGLVVVKWVEDAWEGIFSDGGNILLGEVTRYFGNQATIFGNIHDHPELIQILKQQP